MSDRRFRDKGVRTERAMARLLRSHGVLGRKVSPLYNRREDLRIIVGDVERSVEVKCRATSFSQLYDQPKQRDVLIVKADRQEPLVVLRMSLATGIAKGTA